MRYMIVAFLLLGPSASVAFAAQAPLPIRQDTTILNGSGNQAGDDAGTQRKLVRFTEYLVAVGFLQAIILGLTIWAINRQTSVTKNDERAWIIITPKNWSPSVITVDVGGDFPVNFFEASFKNVGRTPARIIETALRYIAVKKMEELPAEPEYGLRANLGERPLVPTDSFAQLRPLEPAPILMPAEGAEIERGERLLFAYGFVTYKDVYGKKRETRCGYKYFFPEGQWRRIHPPRFETDGPPAYNRAT